MTDKRTGADSPPADNDPHAVTAVFIRIVSGQASEVDYARYVDLWEQRTAAHQAARSHPA
ncbi:hypothetical protein V8Z80_11840 [Orrella sp. JC864]|uniref:hypothetical protein n=1 Tax=Orrella sp. JC864 TaxID=3120298 RepID=UPI0012BC78C3